MRVLLFSMLMCVVFNCSSEEAVVLYPEGIPGEIVIDDQEFVAHDNPNDRFIAGINNPTLTAYFPDADKATGTSVIICPGGGYFGLAIDKEGILVAQRLAQQGVAAFVLKYRMPSPTTMENPAYGPLQDAQQALQVVHDNADKWHLNQDKIGIMGFSAGGHLAASAAVHYKQPVYEGLNKQAIKPAFQILIYPVISMQKEVTHEGSRELLLGEAPTKNAVTYFSNELQVNVNTPQAFIVHANDDKAVPVANAILYTQALNKSRVPVQLMLLPDGGHGFGMNNTVDWFSAMLQWMHHRQLL